MLAPLLVLTALIAACSSGGLSDAGLADAAPRDVGAASDAGPEDRGTLDAQTLDAQTLDARPEDAAAPDATEPDATEADAAELDAMEPDAAEPDAAAPDAAPAVCPTTCQIAAPVEAIPTQGLALWLRADRGAGVGPSGEVCIWCDLSGRGHHMPAQGTPHMVAAAAGALPAVQSGAGAYFARGDLLSITATAGRTLVSVFRLTNPSARTQPVSQGQSGTAGTYVFIDANTFNTTGSFYGVYVTNNAYQSTTRTSTHAAAHVMRVGSMQPGLTVLSQLEYFVNGAAQSITRTAGGFGNGSIESFANANYTAVGSSAALHEVSEVMVYDRPITEPERAQVEAYLAGRYGL